MNPHEQTVFAEIANSLTPSDEAQSDLNAMVELDNEHVAEQLMRYFYEDYMQKHLTGVEHAFAERFVATRLLEIVDSLPVTTLKEYVPEELRTHEYTHSNGIVYTFTVAKEFTEDDVMILNIFMETENDLFGVEFHATDSVRAIGLTHGNHLSYQNALVSLGQHLDELLNK